MEVVQEQPLHQFSKPTMATILCCMCGMEIQQNPANMCISCVRENFDITEGINRQLTIHNCRSCNRFLCPPWQAVKLESKELMSACLRKIPGLNKVKLIDAAWIWTEPHSMRLKIKLTIQKEILNSAVLQQSAIVDFTIRNQQCNTCQASFAQGSWQAVVQVRQRVSHKRTFLFLEQLLLKHHAHAECINIVTFRDGIDFYFTLKQHAMRFLDFLSSHIPAKTKYSRKLISADHKSNVGKFKHNFITEIAPICKDDLLMLPNALASNLSNISPLVLVKAVTAGIHVVDPFTGERQEIDIEKYMRYEFTAAMSGRDLVRFIVLSIDPILSAIRASAKRRGHDRKIRLAECILVRESDFGVNDNQYTCITHLGHILKEGDTVMGFDLSSFALTTSDSDMKASSLKRDIPDVILVRKVYPTKGERKWALKSLQYDEEAILNAKETEAAHEDYEQFLQELEGDKEMRANVNLYKNHKNNNNNNNNNNSSSSSSSHISNAKHKKAVSDAAKATATGKVNIKNSKRSNDKLMTKESKSQSNDDDDDDDEWEDMDDGTNNDDDDDEEAVRLDELLDELTLSVPPASNTTNTNNTTAYTNNTTSATSALTDDDNNIDDNNETEGEMAGNSNTNSSSSSSSSNNNNNGNPIKSGRGRTGRNNSNNSRNLYAILEDTTTATTAAAAAALTSALSTPIVLSVKEAKLVPALSVESTGFDTADYDLNDFKFK